MNKNQTSLSLYEMMMWYYVDSNGGEAHGPCDTSTLSKLLRAGDLSLSSCVRLAPSSWQNVAEARQCEVWSAVESAADDRGVVSPPFATFFWSYIDAAGHEEGPFDTSTMINWTGAMYFTDATQVRLWPHGWIQLSYVTHLLSKCKDEWETI